MSKDQNNDKPVFDERFLKNIKGKDFVLYAGLLDLAHQIGIQSIKVKAVQFPTKDNGFEAICEAYVESKNGASFIEIADANPNNVAPLVRQHILRMAATRAKARALRDMTNIGITCLEELGNIDEIKNDQSSQNNHQSNAQPVQNDKQDNGNIDGKTKTTGNKKKTPVAQEKKKESPKKENPKKESSDSDISSDKPKMSSAQKKAILNLAQRRGLSEEDLIKMSVETFNVNFEYLDASSASVFIRDLQQAA